MTEDTDDRIARLTAKMLKLKLFIILSRGKGRDIRPDLPAHLEYMISLERQGTLFASGPLGTTGNGDGLTIVRASDEAEARAIAEADPFVQNGLRDFTIESWTVMEGALGVTVNFSDGSMRLT